MKIICVGRNYADHAKEMASEVPTEPVLFLKPDTALLRENKPFFYPEFSTEIHFECELVYRVSKPGKYIAPEHCLRHIDAVGLGIDFTARDLQRRAKEKGLPWEVAKAFNDSAPVSQLLPLTDFPPEQVQRFRLEVNGERRQQATTDQMIFGLPQLVAYASKFFTLKTGDLLFTGTPEGVGPVQRGDRLQAWLEDRLLLDFEVK